MEPCQMKDQLQSQLRLVDEFRLIIFSKWLKCLINTVLIVIFRFCDLSVSQFIECRRSSKLLSLVPALSPLGSCHLFPTWFIHPVIYKRSEVDFVSQKKHPCLLSLDKNTIWNLIIGNQPKLLWCLNLVGWVYQFSLIRILSTLGRSHGDNQHRSDSSCKSLMENLTTCKAV